MKYKRLIITVLIFCLALPPAFLGGVASIVNAASLNANPIAYDQSLTAIAGFRNYITLRAEDDDCDPLEYFILDSPSHGYIEEQEGKDVSYIAYAGYDGPDSFTFYVSDGIADSNVATVSITVRTNAAPVADNQSLTAIAGFRNYITLGAEDDDGDPLEYFILDSPSHGYIEEQEGKYVSYIANAGYTGSDSFTFYAFDGIADSNVATVSITIRTNAAPVADNQSLTAIAGFRNYITLGAEDDDGDPLEYFILDSPSHGYIEEQEDNQVSYIAYAGYDGPDSFTFYAFDGIADSNVATVSITVRTNAAPVADNQSLTAIAGFRNYITLGAEDDDGDPLEYFILDSPSHGYIEEQEGKYVSYIANAGYTGSDSFTFYAFDGIADSNVATVSITIRTNAAPVADNQSLTAIAGFRNYITLGAEDDDGDPLEYFILDSPSHGYIEEQEDNQVSYIANAGYNGSDSFTFYASDGIADSNVATVSITVRTNAAPVAVPQTVEAITGVPLSITLTGSDPDGDPISFLIVTDPRFGTLTGSGPDQVYTSDEGFVGSDFFEFVVQDGYGESAPARVSINVILANRAPVANPQTLNASSGVPLPITLTGTDPDGDTLTFQVTDQPDHGTLTGTAPALSYTSTSGYVGPDSFQFTVSDGTLTSAPATVSISVSASGPVTVFFDNFETNLGWVRNPNGTDTARSGMWERANPEHTWWMGPKQLGSTVSGSYDLVTGPRAGWEAGSYDIDNGVTSIKSPSIVLPANSSLTLTLSYYLAHASNSSSADFLRVKVVGSATTTVLQVLGTNRDKDAYWSSASIDLSAFAGQTVYILIEAADNSGASLVEAGVDDVKIVANPQSILSGNTTNSK